MSDPMRTWLQEHQAAAIAVLRAGLPLTRNPAALAEDQWERLGVELMGAMLELLTASTSIRRLPRTTACICPNCRKVVLPDGAMWDVFSHCGRIWTPTPRHLPLPADFWNTARPGDNYDQAIEAS